MSSPQVAYDVERAVFSGKFREHFQRRDGMPSHQQALTDKLTAHFGVQPVTCVRRGGMITSDSHYTKRKLQITYGALAGPAIVCHEVAHHLAVTTTPRRTATAMARHGRTRLRRLCARGAGRLAGHTPGEGVRQVRGLTQADEPRQAPLYERGKRRSSLNERPPRSHGGQRVDIKIRTRQYDGVTLTWTCQHERFFATSLHHQQGWLTGGDVRSHKAAGRLMASPLHLGVPWPRAVDGALFTERRFRPRSRALEWAVHWRTSGRSEHAGGAGCVQPARTCITDHSHP